MINMQEVLETNNMIAHEKLDVRTITMGISLLDCVDSDLAKMNEKIYNKITTYAKDLVSTGDAIGREFGVPIVNKRISVTPIALVGGSACKKSEDFVEIAKTLDKAAKEVGRQLYRRLFRIGFQGNDTGGRASDPLDSRRHLPVPTVCAAPSMSVLPRQVLTWMRSA